MTFLEQVEDACRRFEPETKAALAILSTWYLQPLPHTGGSTAGVRIAWSMAHGRTQTEAIAREYLHRWALAIKPGDQITCDSRVVNRFGQRADALSCFGAPHLLGM
jgi:hypothetical protein